MDVNLLLIGLAVIAGLAILVVIAMVLRAVGTRIKAREGSRLAVTEYQEVDKTRRLVLIRRDNVEHLLLLGGGQDIVVESGIGSQSGAAASLTQSRQADSFSVAPAPKPEPRPVAEPPRGRQAPELSRPAPAPEDRGEPLRSARSEPLRPERREAPRPEAARGARANMRPKAQEPASAATATPAFAFSLNDEDAIDGLPREPLIASQNLRAPVQAGNRREPSPAPVAEVPSLTAEAPPAHAAAPLRPARSAEHMPPLDSLASAVPAEDEEEPHYREGNRTAEMVAEADDTLAPHDPFEDEAVRERIEPAALQADDEHLSEDGPEPEEHREPRLTVPSPARPDAASPVFARGADVPRAGLDELKPTPRPVIVPPPPASPVRPHAPAAESFRPEPTLRPAAPRSEAIRPEPPRRPADLRAARSDHIDLAEVRNSRAGAARSIKPEDPRLPGRSEEAEWNDDVRRPPLLETSRRERPASAGSAKPGAPAGMSWAFRDSDSDRL